MPASKKTARQTVTRETVARHAGVSSAVVSYVLNNGPRTVAPDTREKVLKVIAELGYKPNAIARALKVRRTHTIGLVVPDISNPHFAELSKAVEDAAFARGYALLVGNSSNDSARELLQVSALCARQVDGLLIVRTDGSKDLPAELGGGPPVVVLDRTARKEPFSSVVVDNLGGARAGVQHLIGHGHRAIACIGGPAGFQDRVRGWMAAMTEAGLDVEGLLLRTAFSRDGGYEAARTLFAQPNPPTAIFACSDLQGVGVLRACYETGLRVPDDVAVLAFDGTQEAEFTAPPMAVVYQPLETIAGMAVDLVLNDRGPAKPRHDVAPFRLIPRRSCGC